MIRLSLIIATYNRAGQMLRALESVVAQDAPAGEWECVVVNNNSTDDTEARFAEFAARHAEFNLRMVTERNQGLSHARNRGIAESTGELIAVIDDDERINAGFVRAYIAFFDAWPGAEAAGGKIIPEYPSGRPDWLSPLTERPIANPLDLGDAVCEFPASRIPGGGNMAIRRRIVERFGAFDVTLGRVGGKLVGGEESDFFERLRAGGIRLWYVPGAVMWHIIPSSKLTSDYFRRLSYHVGESQRQRAKMHERYAKALLVEAGKWCASLLLACTLTPRRSLWLLRMRWGITRGLLARD